MADPTPQDPLTPEAPSLAKEAPSPPSTSLAIWEGPALGTGLPGASSALQGCSPATMPCSRLWKNLHHAGHRPRARHLRADPQ